MTQKNRLHKVLGISPDYAFCLHSKERVPYHIIIKVAFTEDSQAGYKAPDEAYFNSESGERSIDNDISMEKTPK